MQPTNPADKNYIDGCLYEYTTVLQPGIYNYSFECMDWNLTNSTPTQWGINVTEINSLPPTLTSGQVLPTSGYNGSTLFIYSVNYTDPDNNAPFYLNVTINSTPFIMVLQNPLDTDYRDGSIYEYITTLDIGNYSYYFNCSDNTFPASAGPYNGPTVKKSQLFDGMVLTYDFESSFMGSTSTSFLYSYKTDNTFSATWTFPSVDWDVNHDNRRLSNVVGVWLSDGDHDPAWILTDVSINDTVELGVIWDGDHTFKVIGEFIYFLPGYGPVEVWNLTDLTKPGGVLWFEKSTGILLNGTVYQTGGNWYTFNFTSANVQFSYVPGFWPPILTSGNVTPWTGDQDTQLNFTVTYTDIDNDTPSFMNVVINGTSFTMDQQNSTDTDFTDGCVYEYVTTLTAGTYNFSFQCSDGLYNTSSITYYGLNVLDTILPTGNISYPLNYSVQFGNSITIGGLANGTGSPIQDITINSTDYTLSIVPIGQLSGSYEFANNTPVANGLTILEVNITDSGGNSILLTVIFTIDNTFPTITMSNPAVNGVTLNEASILVEGLANGTSSNITLFQYNNTDFDLNLDPTNQLAGIFQLENNTALEGLVVIELLMTNNASVTRTLVVWFYVDNRYPYGNISYPIGSGAVQSGSTIRITGYADGSGSPIQNITINSSAYTLSTNPIGQLAGMYEFTNSTAIANGLTSLEINITDSTNRSILLTVSFTVDNVLPNLTLTNPTTNGTIASAASILIEGLVDGTFTNITLFQYNNSNFNLNVNPTNQSSGSFQLENNTYMEGLIVIEITVSDNASLSVTLLLWFYIDEGLLSGTITNPAGNYSSQSGNTISVSGLADGAGVPIQDVSINNSEFTLSISPIGSVSGSFQFTNNTPIPNGIITLVINITDITSDSVLITIIFVVDNLLPIVLITSPTPGVALDLTLINVTGTANGTFSNIISIQINDSRFNINPLIDPTNSTFGTFAFTNITSLSGLVILQITVIDNASLSGFLIIQFYVDTIDPSVSTTNVLTGGAIGGQTLQLIGFADGTGSLITSIIINETRFTLQVNPNQTLAGQFIFENNTGLTDGVFIVLISIQDMANRNYTLVLMFYVDNTAPPVVPSFNANTDGRDVTLSWNPVTDLTNVTYLIFRNGVNIDNTTSTSYYDPDLPPGTYNYSIRAIDKVGNIGKGSSQTVVIKGDDGFPTDMLLIILAIVVGSVIAVSVLVRSRRKKRRPRPRPSPKTPPVAPPSTKTNAVEIVPEEDLKKVKDPTEEKSEIPPSTAILDKKPEEAGPKKFQWRCEKCSKMYTTTTSEEFLCPTCKEKLQPIKEQ
ncbi:MAG: hypothetical protein JSV09_04585 [Thermoplasmata archaeon]|nr:MAG: hypothetical protein JSV09_04585 [Thermoplasmata archaeon]